MQFNSLNDLSVITTIPAATLVRLFDKLSWIICNDIEESLLNSETISELDIGIGKLVFSIEDNSLEYKFIPSMKLEQNIVKTIKEKKNPLVNNLEESIADRIINTYKDMM